MINGIFKKKEKRIILLLLHDKLNYDEQLFEWMNKSNH